MTNSLAAVMISASSAVNSVGNDIRLTISLIFVDSSDQCIVDSIISIM